MELNPDDNSAEPDGSIDPGVAVKVVCACHSRRPEPHPTLETTPYHKSHTHRIQSHRRRQPWNCGWTIFWHRFLRRPRTTPFTPESDNFHTEKLSPRLGKPPSIEFPWHVFLYQMKNGLKIQRKFPRKKNCA